MRTVAALGCDRRNPKRNRFDARTGSSYPWCMKWDEQIRARRADAIADHERKLKDPEERRGIENTRWDALGAIVIFIALSLIALFTDWL